MSDSNTPIASCTGRITVIKDGENGVGIESADVVFAVSLQGQTAPDDDYSGWETLFSDLILTPDYYVWSGTRITNTKGKSWITGKRCLGKCSAFASITEQYALGDSNTTAPTSGWSGIYPTPVKGKYLWTRSELIYQGVSEPVYANYQCVGYFANDGISGTSFTMRGKAIAHYANYTAYKASGNTEKGDILIDNNKNDDSSYSSLSLPSTPYVLSFDSNGNECYDKASNGDAYTVDTELYVSNGTIWADVGKIIGAQGEAGKDALNVVVGTTELYTQWLGDDSYSVAKPGTTMMVVKGGKLLKFGTDYTFIYTTQLFDKDYLDVDYGDGYTLHGYMNAAGVKKITYTADNNRTTQVPSSTSSTTLTVTASDGSKASVTITLHVDLQGKIFKSGIDIANDMITITSDKTMFMNNSGKSMGMFENDKFIADLIDAKTVVTNGLQAQTIDAQDAKISNLNVTNVSVSGTIRSPYKAISAGNELSEVDNVNILTTYAFVNNFSLSWDDAMIGRTIRLSNRTSDRCVITAPSDKYFLVNGENATSLEISPQSCVIIHGYGESGAFKLWVVEGGYRYSDAFTGFVRTFPMKVLSMGFVLGGKTTTDMSSQCTAVGRVGVSRLDLGIYRLYLPTEWTSYFITRGYTSDLAQYLGVMLTGFGSSEGYSTAPIKATVKDISFNAGRTQIYLDVWTSDDDTVNDGSFQYLIYLMDNTSYVIQSSL